MSNLLKIPDQEFINAQIVIRYLTCTSEETEIKEKAEIHFGTGR